VIRLVATDLDGTLWGPDTVVPERHAQAIRELGRRGVTVLAATSRRPRVVRQRLEQAGLALPAVLVDGAIGVDFRTGERFHQAVFDPVEAVAVLATFRDTKLDPCVYVEDPEVDVVVSRTPSTCAAHLDYLDYLGGLAGVEDLDAAVLAGPVYAFSVLGLARERLERAAGLLVSGGAEVLLYAEPRFGGYGLIVNPPGITKWSGIDAFCRLTGISATEVLAVGDGDNDLTMLAQAAVAVAVRGGTERALAAADYVIDPPGENGWASLPDLIQWEGVDGPGQRPGPVRPG
jgi:hydroxymethylpyrimidine pyrophosphatase-like HAD family hydrolase